MSNRLQYESSPYLLQHANNPVDWYPWGEEALHRAKEENKLIIVSIGYAACHWCHVMEHESFEDQEVAKAMNERFICIKVDREERPDIDKVYMDAVLLMSGQGGWPLNAFALPDGRPIYGGTYFQKSVWMQILHQLSDMYSKTPDKAMSYADNLYKAIQDVGNIKKIANHTTFQQGDIIDTLTNWLPQIDTKFGGRKTKANKFPLPMNNLSLLRASKLLHKDVSELAQSTYEAQKVTLEKMAFGGIYDHLGGGFARYSVDAYWKVPHFEKMLYDNGQLVSLYAEAYAAAPSAAKTQKDIYKRTVYQTLEFVERELTSPEGGFYSSLDADSEGEEGKYYTWAFEEIEELLGNEAKLFADYYNVHPFGNWEGKNILFILESEEDFAERWKLDVAEFKAKMETGRKTLLDRRALRVRPGLDDKMLASWNGLMLKGYIDAYKVFKEQRFLDIALKNGNFLLEKLTEDGQLFRSYKEGKKSIQAFLDDYANVIHAFIALYEVTFNEKWMNAAIQYLTYVLTHFSDDQSGMFFYTSDQQEVLVKRKIETQDDVIPSSNAVLAHALLTIGLLTHQTSYRERAVQMLQNMRKNMMENPGWHSVWFQLFLRYTYPHFEVAITGPDAISLKSQMDEYYYPNLIFAGSTQQSGLPILANRVSGNNMIYVCEDYSCKLPVNSPDQAIEQLRSAL